MNLSGRNYQTGGGTYPLVPFDPYRNQKILTKGGDSKMGTNTRLGEPLFGLTSYEGNFSHPDSPFVPDGGPDFSEERPSTRFMNEAAPMPIQLGEISGNLTDRIISLFTKYKGIFLILGALGMIYILKNREALKEKLGLD
jgi:hypothetical protein